jgi:hypothetical protein
METSVLNPRAAELGEPPISEAEKPKDGLTPLPPALQIEHARVTKNTDGFAVRDWFVRLAKGMTAEDVRRPEVWRGVQGKPEKALRTFDTVTCVGFDQDFRLEGFVEHADGRGVVLAVQKINALKPRFEPMLETENFRITWVGHGYGVQRKSDGHIMGRAESSVALAERQLRQYEPAKVK